MPKILFFIESLHSGGKERRLVELIKGLTKYPDIKMELVLIKEDIHYNDIFSAGIKIHYTVRKLIRKDPFVVYKFFKIAKIFQPDIIHVWGYMAAVYAIPTKVVFNIPIINNSITYALNIKMFSKLWVASKLSFPFSDRVIANSYAGLKSHKIVANSKYRVIYNGFDFERNNFIKTDLKEELNLSSKSFLVGMIASFSDAKDYRTFIDSSCLITKQYSNIHFLCVGEGETKETHRMYSLHKQIKNIHFLGYRSDIENICKNLDVGVLLSNTKGHAEGISNAILEMMANGLPVISTSAGGTLELIENNCNGILVKPFNSKIVADNLIKLFKNDVLRGTIGKNAIKRVRQQFHINKMINAYIELYNEVKS